MATIIGTNDDIVRQFARAVEAYEAANPGSEGTVRRTNPASIRVRIINDRFAGMTRSRRHDEVWEFLHAHLNDELMSDLTMLLAIPTSELRNSMANLDFEEPVTSAL